MNGDVDYYAVLRVAKSADEADIRAAYRALAKRYHPDVAAGDRAQATKVFHLITQAYETLCDESLRARYDARQQRADQRASGGPALRNGVAAVRRSHAGRRSRSRAAFVWLGGLFMAMAAVLFLAEVLKFVVANRASTPPVDSTKPSGTAMVAPPSRHLRPWRQHRPSDEPWKDLKRRHPTLARSRSAFASRLASATTAPLWP
jgi:curved DNA-binding protein CbpA